MRKLKIDEEELKSLIEKIINEHFLGINIKNLSKILKDYGFQVSPQIIRRNILKLIKEKRIKYKDGKLEHD